MIQRNSNRRLALASVCIPNTLAALPSATRYASFGIGPLVSLCVMLFPFLLHTVPGDRLHAGLPLAMLGVAGTFVHGTSQNPCGALTILIRIILN